MTGVVLCGGQSLRMGKDKGLHFSRTGRVWAEIMKEKFAYLSIPSVLSINPLQKKNYRKFFEEKSLAVDNPNINIQGPLLGVLSVHLKYPDQNLMVVACDLINLDEVVLKKLFSNYNSSQVEAIAFKGERIEPLCAIYSSHGLAKIHEACQAGKLRRNSMMHALEELSAAYIPIPEEWKSSFKNFNCTEEFN
jgi:molybdopterin-guanine dinucleotide biosynthesis protein A